MRSTLRTSPLSHSEVFSVLVLVAALTASLARGVVPRNVTNFLATLRVRVQLVAVDLHFFFWFSIYLFTTSRDTVPTDDMKLLLVQRDGNLVFNDLNSRLNE